MESNQECENSCISLITAASCSRHLLSGGCRAELGVPLHAVVKEDVGTEIQDFKLQYFNGELFVDHKRVFYGPKYRRMGLGLGPVRLRVLQNLVYAHRKGYQGNRNGEGFILGGLFVIGGVLLERREKEFGDKADLYSILEAAEKINKRQ